MLRFVYIHVLFSLYFIYSIDLVMHCIGTIVIYEINVTHKCLAKESKIKLQIIRHLFNISTDTCHGVEQSHF